MFIVVAYNLGIHCITACVWGFVCSLLPEGQSSNTLFSHILGLNETLQWQHGKFSEFWSFMGSTAITKVYSPPSLFPSLFRCHFLSANRGKWAHQWAYKVAFLGRGFSIVHYLCQSQFWCTKVDSNFCRMKKRRGFFLLHLINQFNLFVIIWIIYWIE